MSRSKQLWEAECAQICRDYQDGKLTLEQARDLLIDRGWTGYDATNELEAWAEA